MKLKTGVGNGRSALERRLVSYGSMSMAIAAAALAPSANASIVETAVNATTPTGGGLIFNVTTGAVSTIQSSQLINGSLLPGATPGNFGLLNSNPPPSAKKTWFIASSLGNNKFAVSFNNHTNASSVARIAQSAVIGAGRTFKNGFGSQMLADNSFGSLAPGNWKSLGTGYVGVDFELSNQLYYGWAQITINPDYTATLDAVAYNNVAGAPLTTPGAAPEPSSLLLLALGAAGIAAYRRKLARKRE